MIPSIEESLFPNLEPVILKILSIISGKLQLNAADVIGIFCKYLTNPTMKIMIQHLNPLLSDQKDALKRRGAAYTIESKLFFNSIFKKEIEKQKKKLLII